MTTPTPFSKLPVADQLLVMDLLEMHDDSCPDYEAWANKGSEAQIAAWLAEGRAEREDGNI